MVNNQAPFFIVTVVTFYALFSIFMAEADGQNRKVYIVYLGETKYGDSKLTTESHHELLANILGSKEKSLESMVYSYRHGFSGFAVKLTKSQAQKLAEIPGVLGVLPNSVYKMHTTRSWDFLGLPSSSSSHSNNLLHRSKMGDDIIIGVIDSGIWPESEAFGDKGLGPIPSRWKGICESGAEFNSTNCNRKIIGARSYSKGFMEEFGHETLAKANEYLSPRDASGHGTHVASTAAGSMVTNVSYLGLGTGTVRGGAPLARLAIYKVLWTSESQGSSADILKAIDHAIHDGVDVLSMSIGMSIPLFPEYNKKNDNYVQWSQSVILFGSSPNVYRAFKKMKKKKATWPIVKHRPEQQGVVECGYYVMRYMCEIINHQGELIVTLMSDAPSTYTQEDIDVVRTEWAEFVATHIFFV